MVTPGLAFFALTCAIFKVGAVPVLVDSGMGVRNLGKCLAEAEPELLAFSSSIFAPTIAVAPLVSTSMPK